MFFRHAKYRDVCIECSNLRRFGKHLKGKGMFWNMSGYAMGISTKLDITDEDKSNWYWNDTASRRGWKYLG